ncbi:uncharacterized protein BJ171DRAFT_86346 [Polychytrium aggregatum]|uniref:uncharacterized protein n=2 Tax=Polychytrium aggregatum TaxID=110093 RepID=UPI0022FE1A6A|nr:uncharacterized protein BJ171DRAFT_86346 [Polychytrium aggregatum]KAI9190589.1 hypothetical protein BJ171DRAFT_86346 [Polychytrium aggregatum]
MDSGNDKPFSLSSFLPRPRAASRTQLAVTTALPESVPAERPPLTERTTSLDVVSSITNAGSMFPSMDRGQRLLSPRTRPLPDDLPGMGRTVDSPLDSAQSRPYDIPVDIPPALRARPPPRKTSHIPPGLPTPLMIPLHPSTPVSSYPSSSSAKSPSAVSGPPPVTHFIPPPPPPAPLARLVIPLPAPESDRPEPLSPTPSLLRSRSQPNIIAGRWDPQANPDVFANFPSHPSSPASSTPPQSPWSPRDIRHITHSHSAGTLSPKPILVVNVAKASSTASSASASSSSSSARSHEPLVSSPQAQKSAPAQIRLFERPRRYRRSSELPYLVSGSGSSSSPFHTDPRSQGLAPIQEQVQVYTSEGTMPLPQLASRSAPPSPTPSSDSSASDSPPQPIAPNAIPAEQLLSPRLQFERPPRPTNRVNRTPVIPVNAMIASPPTVPLPPLPPADEPPNIPVAASSYVDQPVAQSVGQPVAQPVGLRVGQPVNRPSRPGQFRDPFRPNTAPLPNNPATSTPASLSRPKPGGGLPVPKQRPDFPVKDPIQQVLGELKQTIKIYHSTQHAEMTKVLVDYDQFLMRFLRAKRFNIQESLTMVLSYWNYRTKVLKISLDRVSDAVCEILRSKFVTLPPIRDSGKRQVILLHTRRLSSKSDQGKFDSMDIMRALWLVLEMASEDRLTIMYGVTIINDATGAGWDNLSPGLPKLLISSLQNRFPLRIGRIYVLYPTQIMKLFWTTIKSLLKTKLMFRVVLLENENDASQVLINDFGLECLPEFMGGKVPFDEAQWTEEILLTVLQADSQTKTTVLNRQLSNNRKNVVIAPKPRVNTQIQGLLDQLPPS